MKLIEQYHIGVTTIDGIERLVLAFVVDENQNPKFTPPYMTLSWIDDQIIDPNQDASQQASPKQGLMVQDLTTSHCWLFVVPSQYSASSCEDVRALIERYGDLYVAALNSKKEVLSSACFQIS